MCRASRAFFCPPRAPRALRALHSFHAFCAIVAIASALAAGGLWAASPSPLVAEGQLGPGWRVVGLPGQKPPLTRYSAETVDGRAALRLVAHASYGNLVFDAPAQAAPARIVWSWRLEQRNEGVDLAQKAGDDAAVKVCLSFDLPLAQVPFVERQMLRLARSRSAEPLPAATLCWVWGHGEATGALVANPYSRRVRSIVLRNQGDGTGRWFDEERDVAADWRRAFGDESAEPPPLAAVVVAADGDNTGGRSTAFLAGLRFAP